MSEAVEASLGYFLNIWLMKHKCQNLLKPLGTMICQNSQFYYPSDPFSFHHFNVRHPVVEILGPPKSVLIVLSAQNNYKIKS